MKYSALGAAVFGAVLASAASAEVTIELGGGSIIVTGELLGVEDGVYVIRTAIGDIRMPADMVTCTGGDCPVLEPEITMDVRIKTSPAFADGLVPDLVAAYAAQTGASYEETGAGTGTLTSPEGEVTGLLDVQTTDDDAAFAALMAGEAEIILTERRATEEEITAFLAAEMGDLTSPAQEQIFGVDAATVVMSDLNPVESITVAQAAAVFAGEITNWSQLGGLALPIKVYAPSDDTTTARYFQRAVLDPAGAGFADTIDRTKTEAEIAAAVSTDPFAIGLTSQTASVAARPAPLEGACGIRNVATDFSVRAEDYPLTHRYYAYTSSRAVAPAVAEMMALLGSATGQDLVAANGFTNLNAEQTDLNSFGQRLAFALSSPDLDADLPNLRAFAGEVLDADRLSTTFRFATGSSALDNKARGDVIRLADLLQQPQYSNVEVLLIGFTDSIGGTDINTDLSQRRAAQVLQDVVEISGGALAADRMTALGFGATNPVSCNDTEAGQEMNRRVEVWVR